MVAADINTQVIKRSNIIVDTTTRERLNNYDSLHKTNVLQPKENTGFGKSEEIKTRKEEAKNSDD
ncbi:11794_t:CDS:2 [Funneliformis mosseae]|uniref:11794_t:CDS:1 n=1 Tax=Funneliformis mosseae TaxID=27381 RepID=A0A9N9EUS6_FUNMO|nr:11794_t:CDS:2 [Funneliformis mosseae]